ncbi:organic hydroperoxide resistance protein [Bacillus massiliglaciei]|uniref:organic hydroperoxide resistance protein n=1 Tax=Bacillus massiliglaciei TaxID=1816693 RepID=UPI000A5AC1F0|nr:organic hydroperoxide resistance protein [Bacillus massiliglaciei]
MEALYTGKVKASGGREGHVKSEDGLIDFDVRMPKALGGSGEKATNPEQLFAAGFAACFDGALNLTLQKAKVKANTEVTANVSIGKDLQNDGLMLGVELEISIPELSREEAEKYVQQAHQTCPYSKATRGNIDVTLHVV